MGKSGKTEKGLASSMKKINILHLRTSNFFGGPEKQILEHGRTIDKARFGFFICSFLEKGQLNEFINEGTKRGFDAYALKTRFAFDLSAIFKLRTLLKEKNIDILCTHGYKSDLIGLLAARMRRIPIIAFSRGWTKENLKIRLYYWLDRRALRMVNRVVAVSEAKKRELVKLGIKEEKIIKIHNAIEPDKPSLSKNITREDIIKEFNLQKEIKIIAAAGRLSPEKGFDYFLKAIPELLNSDFKLHFMILGEGQEREKLQKLAEELGISEFVTFAGFRKDLPGILKNIDIFVNPSLSEGLPNVVLEALAMSKPVVATAVGGVPELILPNTTGILIEAGNSKALAQGILDLLNDPDQAQKMGNEGRKLVQKSFSFEDQNGKLEKLYLEVLTNSKKKP